MMLILLLANVLAVNQNVQPAKSEPNIIIVPDDYLTIQKAINSSNDGDTIYVKAGTYYEHVVVNKTVSLLGESSESAIIDGNRTGNVVSITANNVCIKNFTVQNSGYGDEEGCIYTDSSGAIIWGSKIVSHHIGIYLKSASYFNVTSNTIIGGSYAGIILYGVDHGILMYNEIINSGTHGIDLDEASNIIIANNLITNNANGDGIYLTTYRNGIGAPYCNITINGNNIVDNLYGILIFTWYLCPSATARIIGNDIIRNKVAFRHCSSFKVFAEPHSIYHNNFINNSKQIEFSKVIVEHVWDDSYPSGGNHWSNYNGTDLKCGADQNSFGWDGIGDTAYIIDANNVDHYPSMNSWPLACLEVETVVVGEAPEVSFRVWVNEIEPCQYSTAYFLLKPTIYSVKVESRLSLQDPGDPTKYYIYTFHHGEDGSRQNPRSVMLDIDKTLIAFYNVKVIYVQKSL